MGVLQAHTSAGPCPPVVYHTKPMTDTITHARTIAAPLSIRPEQAAATIALLDDGNTLPFIARYRKEQTGGLDEDQIRRLSETLATLRALDDRRAPLVASVQEQGKLTPELLALLSAAETRTALSRPRARPLVVMAAMPPRRQGSSLGPTDDAAEGDRHDVEELVWRVVWSLRGSASVSKWSRLLVLAGWSMTLRSAVEHSSPARYYRDPPSP
jgi:hypothetical protein